MAVKLVHGYCRPLIWAAHSHGPLEIARLGGIEAILKAMDEHPKSAGVQEKACAALLNIGRSNEDLQERIKKAGAEAKVRRAMAAPNAIAQAMELGKQLLDRLGKLGGV